jgi:hypothetical protein
MDVEMDLWMIDATVPFVSKRMSIHQQIFLLVQTVLAQTLEQRNEGLKALIARMEARYASNRKDFVESIKGKNIYADATEKDFKEDYAF